MSSLTPDQKLAAYFLGRRIAGQRRKQDRVPVAYLYNGVRLPGLPEWDKEAYPFGYIWEDKYGARYLLCYKNEPVVGEVTTGPIAGSDRLYSPTTTMHLRYQAKSDLSGWVFLNESQVVANSGTAFAYGYTLIWSDFNIMRDDGVTIYLAASDPVPVYE